MAWTFPNNWVDGQIVGAADLNKIRYDLEHWGGPVDCGGYAPVNMGSFAIGTPTSPIMTSVAGRAYLTIKGPSDAGILELATGAADADGSLIGQIAFTDPLNSQSEKRIATIQATRSGTTANNRGSAMMFATRADGTTGLSERMRIDNQGRVGIGTAGPLALLQVGAGTPLAAGTLDVYATNYTVAVARANMQVLTTDALAIDKGGSLGLGGVGSGNPYIFATLAGRSENNAYAGYLQLCTMTSSAVLTERMRITAAGNVGIGTTNPLAALSVYGNNGTWGTASFIGSATRGVSIGDNGTAPMIQGATGPSTAITTNLALNPNGGNVGIGTTSPSTRLHVQDTGGTLHLVTLVNNTASANGNNVRVRLGPHSGFSVSPELSPYVEGIVDGAGTGASGLAFGTYSGSSLIERLRILSNGNVGMGTASPSFPLDLFSTNSDYQIRLANYAGCSGDAAGAGCFGQNLYRTGEGQFRAFATHGTLGGVAAFFQGAIMEVRYFTVGSTAGAAVTTTVAFSAGYNGMKCPTLPSTNPGAGTKAFWYDPADGNRVKFAA